MKMTVFWVVAPCSPVEVYRRFIGTCCLHHKGDEALIALMMEAATPASFFGGPRLKSLSGDRLS
jgi:hypothetical protein